MSDVDHKSHAARLRETRHAAIPVLRALSMTLICVPPVGILIYFVPSPAYSVGSSWLWVWILAALFFVGVLSRILVSDWGLAQFRARAKVADHDRHDDRFEAPLERDRVADYYLAQFLSSAYAPGTTESMSAIISAPSVISRITEKHDLGVYRTDVKVMRTMQGSKMLVLVPVLRILRGKVVGSLSVDIDGTAARTLPFDLSRGLLLTMLVTAFSIVHGTTEQTLLRDLKIAAVGRHAINPSPKHPLLSGLEEAAQRSTALQNDKVALRRIALAALTSDFVFVIVPGGLETAKRISVAYRRGYPSGVHGLAARFQRAIGLGRSNFSIPIGLAGDSRSYHLEVSGPSDMFVENSYIEVPRLEHAGLLIDEVSDADRVRDQVMVIAPRAGDNCTHLYLRDYDGAPHVATLGEDVKFAPVWPRFRIELREIPPGLLGPILAVSVWLAILAWIVGVFHDFVFKGLGIVGPSWPTLIFGVPAIVVGWLLSRVTAEQFRTISVGTFSLLSTLALNAAMLVTFAALKSSGASTFQADIGLLHVEHPTWTIMMVATAIHVTACFVVLTTRNIRYAATINEGTTR